MGFDEIVQSLDAVAQDVPVEQPKVSAEETPQEAAPESETPATQEAVQAESTEEVSGEQPSAEPKKPRFQERIDEITRKRHEAERRAEYWENVARGEVPKPPTVPSPTTEVIPLFPEPPPRLESFAQSQDPYSDLNIATAEWAVRKSQHVNNFKTQREFQVRQIAEAQHTRDQKMQAGVEKYEDFDPVTDQLGRVITPPMRDALFDSDHFIDVAYYLGKNLTEVQRISKMSPLGQIREIGKLEDRLAAQAKNLKPKQVNQPTRVEPAGQGIPPVKPSVRKDFDTAMTSRSVNDWAKYLESLS